jgi:membrane associated rhomboid family serine protease
VKATLALGLLFVFGLATGQGALDLGAPGLASVFLCHFVHVSLDQVLWAGVPALLFAGALEARVGTGRTLLVALGVALAVSGAVLALEHGRLASYCGASGLGHGLASAWAVRARGPGLVLLALLLAKTGFEALSGHLVCDVGLENAGSLPVPLAHAVGLLAGTVLGRWQGSNFERSLASLPA